VRVAFADMLFSWPPNGGADVDLFHVVQGLCQAGIEAKLFYARIEGADDRGVVDEAALPFPCEAVSFEAGAYTPDAVKKRFRKQVDAFQPNLVIASHAFSMKPYLLEGLEGHAVVSRYYAHELTCARDPRRFKDHAPCALDYLRHPDACRDCATVSQRPFIAAQNHRAWTADYLAARAYEPGHHARTLASLRTCRGVVVSNSSLREELLAFHPDVRVLPGGVGVHRFDGARPPHDEPVVTILMSGRADDPLKGLSVLKEAGERLWRARQDFQMKVTHYDHEIQTPWLRCAGWRDHDALMGLYEEAGIVVVPSIWQEPFGLAAVEAMAAGRPVVASRSGGLLDIVRDGETGLLCTPGDAGELTGCLAMLLDDPALRARMGAEGRRVAREAYDWGVVIERHYLPLLEELTH
jgi:glycosyltransferase involved in cell wall biosynthesis